MSQNERMVAKRTLQWKTNYFLPRSTLMLTTILAFFFQLTKQKIVLKQPSIPSIALKTTRNINSIDLSSIFDLSEVKKSTFKYSSSHGSMKYKLDFIRKGCITKDYKFSYFQFLPQSFNFNTKYSFKGYDSQLMEGKNGEFDGTCVISKTQLEQDFIKTKFTFKSTPVECMRVSGVYRSSINPISDGFILIGLFKPNSVGEFSKGYQFEVKNIQQGTQFINLGLDLSSQDAIISVDDYRNGRVQARFSFVKQFPESENEKLHTRIVECISSPSGFVSTCTNLDLDPNQSILQSQSKIQFVCCEYRPIENFGSEADSGSESDIFCYTIEQVTSGQTIQYTENMYQKKESSLKVSKVFTTDGQKSVNLGILKSQKGDWISIYRVNFDKSELQICRIFSHSDKLAAETYSRDCKV